MAENSKIQWTNHTMNPWRGCTKVSAGCAHCYAETLSARNPDVLGVWGPNGTRVVAAEAQWREPLKWDKTAKEAGERHRVFCASLADVFEDWTGTMSSSDGAVLHVCAECDAWRTMEKMCHGPTAHMPLTMDAVRERLFRLIDATPHLDWLLLTKRPENINRMMPTRNINHDEWNGTLDGYWHLKNQPRPNLWLGASCEDQATADKRIPHLLKVPAAVRFLSCEPLLGPLDLRAYLCDADEKYQTFASPVGIDWVIAGGESGPGARACYVEWIRGLVHQCETAGVACFVKQLGSHPCEGPGVFRRFPVADKKGGDIDEFPADLRVRQFPEVTT